MAIRITGMNSGLDTETIISELVKAKSEKKNKLIKQQTKVQWKQDAWKELNTKVYALYSKTLSNMRLASDYLKKTTKVSNTAAASVITGTNAVNGVQTLKIDKLAKSGYLTGAEVAKDSSGNKISAATKLGDMGIGNQVGADGNPVSEEMVLTLGDASKGNTSEVRISLTADMTVNDVVAKLKEAGLNASFDEKNQRFFISSKETGADYNFEITGSSNALSKLGLDYDYNNTDPSKAQKIKGQDAEILLNGALFKSSSNTFEVNGLTITATAETAEEFTIKTTDDTDGIYDMIKNFFKEYNALVNEMDKLYNAASSKGYEPLTDEEKDAMTEKEVEKWEEKIKDSILRKDSRLSEVSSAMRSVMAAGVTVGGEKMYLSDFGIETLGYFLSADNEKNAYHIDGDPDDTATSGKADKLKTAIANDPSTVVDFFTNLSKNLYTKLGDLMKKTNYSSMYTLYDDVSMKNEYNSYKEKIAKQEQLIKDYEDRYYKKFSAMEVALGKLQSKESALSGMFM